MKFPKLFKKTSTGAIEFWEVEASSVLLDIPCGTIRTYWGQVGGKTQEAEDIIRVGKNLGKANETTSFQQAELEAQAQWEKKLKKGYVKSLEDAVAGKVDSVIEGGISPMLAHRYDEQGHKIVFPAYAQPKLDGHRCIAVVKDGACTLWSRTRKPIKSVPHIVKAVEDMANSYGLNDIIFDGELYNHDYRDRFEQLTSFIRQETPKAGYEVVQYHIYDLAMNSVEFANRTLILKEFVHIDYCLRIVETVSIIDEDDLMLAFERFLALGYEGAIVRNVAGKYVNKRSYDLLKIKTFLDSEFKCIGVEEGRGKLAGHAIFVCQMDNGTEFRAKMKGTTESLKQYWEHPELAIGKMLTVKFQGYTNKNGVPRFPVALRFLVAL